MRGYASGDYVDVISRLEGLTGETAEAPEVHFYLGVCYLLTDRIHLAIDPLKRAAASKSAFAPEARLALAKALLLEEDVPGARRELSALAQEDGALAREARRMIDGLSGLDAPDTH